MSDLVKSTVEEGKALDPPKRSFVDVVGRVIALVPEGHGLKARLEKIRDDAGFLPPEGEYVSWERLIDVLVEHFPNGPTESWSREIGSIVRGAS